MRAGLSAGAFILSGAGALAQPAAATAPPAAAPAQPGATAAFANAPVPAASVAASAEDGRKRYTSYCARCHGLNLVNTSGATFDLRTFPPADKERFVRSITQGLRAMPAWGGTIKPEEIDALWAYVGAVNGWPSATPAR